MGRIVKTTLLLAGALLLVLLVRSIGAAGVRESLARFGSGFVVVIAFELVIDACHTLGWRRSFAPLLGNAPPARTAARATHGSPGVLGFWRLYWIRQAGTAVNQLTPTATLGGEVVKALLLRPQVATADALASLMITKVSFTMAQAALVVGGLAVVLGRMEKEPILASAAWLGTAAIVLGVLGFWLVQRRGMFTALANALWRLGIHTPFLDRVRASAAALDARLIAFHRDHAGAFAASLGWHFVGQLGSVLQLVVMLAWLGIPVDLATALAIEALAIIADSALFFVPARLGVQEGGRVLVFTALGMRANDGLVVALITRVTQLAVAALGLAAFGYFSLTSRPSAPSIGDEGEADASATAPETGARHRGHIQ